MREALFQAIQEAHQTLRPQVRTTPLEYSVLLSEELGCELYFKCEHRKDLILHSKSEDDLSEEDLEYLLADAEQSVWSDIKQTSLIGVLAMLGLSIS